MPASTGGVEEPGLELFLEARQDHRQLVGSESPAPELGENDELEQLNRGFKIGKLPPVLVPSESELRVGEPSGGEELP